MRIRPVSEVGSADNKWCSNVQCRHEPDIVLWPTLVRSLGESGSRIAGQSGPLGPKANIPRVCAEIMLKQQAKARQRFALEHVRFSVRDRFRGVLSYATEALSGFAIRVALRSWIRFSRRCATTLRVAASTAFSS